MQIVALLIILLVFTLNFRRYDSVIDAHLKKRNNICPHCGIAFKEIYSQA